MPPKPGYKQRPHVGIYDIAESLHKETGIQLYVIRDIIMPKLFRTISDALASGDSVEIRNFASFDVVLRQARRARNPFVAGSEFTIPPHAAVKTKICKALKARVARLTPLIKRKEAPHLPKEPTALDNVDANPHPGKFQTSEELQENY